MAKVFICGHGGWQPSDGYTKVPKGATIKFYTMLGKAMRSSDVNRLILGSYTGDPDGEFGAFRTVPNMRVYPDDLKYKNSAIADAATVGVETYFTDEDDGVQLSEIFEEKGSKDYVWSCCRSLEMNDHVKSSQYGSGIADTQSADGFGDIFDGRWVATHKF